MGSGLLGLGSATAIVGWILVFATDHWVAGAAAIYAGSGLILAAVIAGLAGMAARAWRSGAEDEAADNSHPAGPRPELAPGAPRPRPWSRAGAWARGAGPRRAAELTAIHRRAETGAFRDKTVSAPNPGEPPRVSRDIVWLSTDSSLIAIVALVAIALIALPPVDSDYHPGSAAEWVLYAVVVVPAGLALAARSIKRVANDYWDAWRLLVAELFRPGSERDGPAAHN